MKTLDVRGMQCPKPIILTKQALQDSHQLHILIDDVIVRRNVSSFLTENNYTFTNDNGNIMVSDKTLSSDGAKEQAGLSPIVVIGSEELGLGDSELGKTLMSAFLTSLKELVPLPTSLYLYNGGALLVKNAATKNQLSELQELGVNIQICGACVNFYNLTNAVEPFGTTNMLTIVQAMASRKVLKP
ncbi:MAG: sulfurtransferase-like selenium metabolism protein YedF [Spirochaetaceae bacterium]|nr:sulfurtransferase-like selenium metabolism protein YedF [Spirochaetaceae bacterium]